jgi:hypothetical protein
MKLCSASGRKHIGNFKSLLSTMDPPTIQGRLRRDMPPSMIVFKLSFRKMQALPQLATMVGDAPDPT